MMLAPACTSSATNEAMSSGVSLNTVLPSSMTGGPALEWTRIGTVGAAARIWRVISIMLEMPIAAIGADNVGTGRCRGFGCAIRLNAHHGAEALDAGLEGESANHRQLGVFLGGLDGLLGFHHRRHGLDADGVGATFRQGDDLCLEGLVQLLGRSVAAFLDDDVAGGTDRRSHIAFVADGLLRQLGCGKINLVDLVGEARSSSA